MKADEIWTPRERPILGTGSAHYVSDWGPTKRKRPIGFAPPKAKRKRKRKT